MKHEATTDCFALQSKTETGLLFCDAAPPTSTFAHDVMTGLQKAQKEIPSKYLYDRKGSLLFDEICTLDEYYPTRTELSILTEHGAELSLRIPEAALVIELGSGSHRKIDLLLQFLPQTAAYVAIDISRDFMLEASEHINALYPQLKVTALCADYTAISALPAQMLEHDGPRLAFFPGSTIGNFKPAFAATFLRRWSAMLRPGDQFLCGVDLIKERRVLHAAYNDSRGVTAQFNLNLLERMNRELGADFDKSAFEHNAGFNEAESRIEMHLVSTRDQVVTFAPLGFSCHFRQGESIHTENSYKYTAESFRDLAAKAGFDLSAAYSDRENLFSLNLLTVSSQGERAEDAARLHEVASAHGAGGLQ